MFCPNNQKSDWVIDFDPRGHDPKDLRKTLSMPEIPTSWSKVTIPSRNKLYMGVAGKVEGWGSGGRIQYLLDKGNKSYDELGVIFEKIEDFN